MTDERAVLDCLLENARYEVADIARMTGLDAGAVEDAIDRLEETGTVRGYKPVVDWSRTDDEHVLAVVELDVELDRETGYGDVARRLAAYPEVRTLRLVSGEYDFLMEVESDSMREVGRFVAEEVAPVPEITGTVTHYAMTTYTERGIEFDGYDDDDRPPLSP